MDAPEEDSDIKLQKVSSELIAAFDQRLASFLRKPDGAGGSRVRARVRTREASYLMASLLDPFQELPQLLDPHLPKWLPMLAEAFLEYLQTRRRRRAREASAASALLMPLPTAICKLIYTFCKIRGEKVIVRFLNVETKYLELLLTALEDAERQQQQQQPTTADDPPPADSAQWTWEERYVVLLWLSHLMFAPFDLSTISSVYMDDVDLAGIPGFFWPSNVPGITVRILPLAIKYLASPGKERDAARALLVRMAMRRDMQQLGVLHALVQWALYWLRPRAGDEDEAVQSPYKYIGVLGFLAGILASAADSADMDKYASTIFYTVSAISASTEDGMSRIVRSSALAKKTIIKVMRSIAVAKLKRETRDLAGVELVEATVGYLLESLADNDTPVRFAASKALSIITLGLPGYMASEVVQAVLQALERNVLLVKNASDSSLPPKRDLTSVDPLEWHGLILTLSHLLYRRSPPVDSLDKIIHALLLGLSFERRSPSGGSIGTNVRDAACFGLWALARRYSTTELLAVSDTGPSVLQLIATDLVVTASLDPAGNIRRGSSAALQELIGRHPDTVSHGIALVQAVDYHAVALRSRAIHSVAASATQLDDVQYGEAILDALLGWRGAGDADAAARRGAGASYGNVMAHGGGGGGGVECGQLVESSVARVWRPMQALQTRQVEERHGYLLAVASVLDQLPSLVARQSEAGTVLVASLGNLVEAELDMLLAILQGVESTTFRKPELIAEGVCRLLISCFPILQAAAVGLSTAIEKGLLVSGPDLLSTSNSSRFKETVSTIDSSKIDNQARLLSILSTATTLINSWLARPEPEVISAASEAAVVLLIFSNPEQREEIIQGWAGLVRTAKRSGTGAGFFRALTSAYPVIALSKTPQDVARMISGPLLDRWARDTYVDTRVAILQSLIHSEVLLQNVEQLLGPIAEGLEDYTTNARGDVGSHVRLQAIKATKYLWTSVGRLENGGADVDKAVTSLLLPIYRLAAEKLDRVRVEAQATLALVLHPETSTQFLKLTFSSQSYFTYLLQLPTSTTDLLRPPFLAQTSSLSPDTWIDALLTGYVTSADTGNEDLVIASRAALTTYCTTSSSNRKRICTALLRNLKRQQGNDRVVVPTLAIIAFLFSVGVYDDLEADDPNWGKSLCLQTQKAAYKTGNVRKLEACVRVYGGLARAGQGGGGGGVEEAKKRLAALMGHPWPRVRAAVVDELWWLFGEEEGLGEKLKGVDWGTADKARIKALVAELGLDAR